MELCKKLEFDQTNKWYKHYPESVSGNETHKCLWDFEVQTNHIISAGRPDLVIVNDKKKEKLPNNRLSCPARLQSKNKRKRREIST